MPGMRNGVERLAVRRRQRLSLRRVRGNALLRRQTAVPAMWQTGVRRRSSSSVLQRRQPTGAMCPLPSIGPPLRQAARRSVYSRRQGNRPSARRLSPDPFPPGLREPDYA